MLIDSSGLKISRFPTLGGNSQLIFNYVPSYASPFPLIFRFGRQFKRSRSFCFSLRQGWVTRETRIWLNFRERKKRDPFPRPPWNFFFFIRLTRASLSRSYNFSSTLSLSLSLYFVPFLPSLFFFLFHSELRRHVFHSFVVKGLPLFIVLWSDLLVPTFPELNICTRHAYAVLVTHGRRNTRSVTEIHVHSRSIRLETFSTVRICAWVTGLISNSSR